VSAVDKFLEFLFEGLFFFLLVDFPLREIGPCPVVDSKIFSPPFLSVTSGNPTQCLLVLFLLDPPRGGREGFLFWLFAIFFSAETRRVDKPWILSLSI